MNAKIAKINSTQKLFGLPYLYELQEYNKISLKHLLIQTCSFGIKLNYNLLAYFHMI